MDVNDRRKGRPWLAFTIGIVVLLAAALAWLGGREDLRLPLPWQESPEFRAVELPPDYEETIVLWDYPWPLWEPVLDPMTFVADDTQRPSYRKLLDRALADFRRLYPGIQVEVRLLSFAEGPGEVAAALAAGHGPDVLAVWWDSPLPPSDRLVPVTPYLKEGDQEAYHPLAWELAATAGAGGEGEGAATARSPGARSAGRPEVWAWPRWIAFHPWLLNVATVAPPSGDATPSGGPQPLPPPWREAQEEGWTVAQAREWLASPEAAGRPPFVPGTGGLPLLGELLAGRPDPTATATALTELRRLAGEQDGPPAIFAALKEGRFRLAGGLGPATAAWPFLPALGRDRGEPVPPYALLAPPLPSHPGIGSDPDGHEAGPGSRPENLQGNMLPGPRPVVSLGAYAVPRPRDAAAPEKIQAAMELARFLSRRLAVEPLDRFLAVPAPEAVWTLWRDATPLPGPVVDQLIRWAGGAVGGRFRPYPPAPLMAHLASGGSRLQGATARFWQGDADAGEIVDLLWPPGGDDSRQNSTAAGTETP